MVFRVAVGEAADEVVGLRLAPAQGVETHGGRIWAESEVDEGSSLKFTLPLEAG